MHHGPRNWNGGDRAENSIMQTISIAVSAILIAAGLITAPSLINNARDNNVKNDLANVTYAQEAFLSSGGLYSPSLRQLETGEAMINGAVTDKGFGMVLSKRDVTLTIGSSPSCFAVFSKSESGSTFYRSSNGTSTGKIGITWPVTAPTGFPASCSWPSDPNQIVTTAGNLVSTPYYALGDVVITPNISYDGTTWSRVVSNVYMHGVRQDVPLASLVNGTRYVSQWEVANDGPSDVTIVLDWVDNNSHYYIIKPGERRLVSTNGVSNAYDSTYRFADMALETVGGAGLLFREIIVKAN